MRVLGLRNFLPCLIATVLAGCGTIATPEAQSSPQFLSAPVAECGPVDVRLIDAALRTVAVAPNLERVWTGYWKEDQPVIFYVPGKMALAISPSALSEPFVPVNQAALPEQLLGLAHVACGPLTGLTGNFDTAYALGGLTAIAVKLELTPYETLEVLFHEGFHEWQKAAFGRTVGASSIALHDEVRSDLDLLREPRLVASMELERRLLQAALAARSRAEIVQLTRAYLAVKRERTASMPVGARHTELNVERKEGSASIVGHEAAAIAYGRPLDEPYAQLWMLTAEPPASLPAGDSAFARFRMRAFGAGAVGAWILTRLGEQWRPELQRGESFETLLAGASGFDALRDSVLADDARAKFGWSELLADAEQWRETTSELTEDDFYRLRPFRVTVEFPAFSNEAPSYSVSHGGLAAVPENNVLIFADTRVATLEYGPIRLHSQERPILVDQRLQSGSYSFSLMMQERPKVTGLEGTGGSVTGEGLSIEIGSPAQVEQREDALIVRVQAS